TTIFLMLSITLTPLRPVDDSRDLDRGGVAHAEAAADGCRAAAAAAAAELLREREHETRARRAGGMADGDGAAVDVEPVAERPFARRVAVGEHARRGEGHAREGLVDLDAVERIDAPAERVDRLHDRRRRGDRELLRIPRDRSHGLDLADRLEPEL